jgi:hypothetical protein
MGKGGLFKRTQAREGDHVNLEGIMPLSRKELCERASEALSFKIHRHQFYYLLERGYISPPIGAVGPSYIFSESHVDELINAARDHLRVSLGERLACK